MDTLIVYCSRHGCTEKAVKEIMGKMKGQVTVVNLKKNRPPDLQGYQQIIIGASIHAGRVQGAIRKFCQGNLTILLQKKIGLFLSCMEEGEKAQAQFNLAYPRELREHATATGMFGGEFDFTRMNFLEKFIVKKVAKVEESISRYDPQKVAAFIQQVGDPPFKS